MYLSKEIPDVSSARVAGSNVCPLLPDIVNACYVDVDNTRQPRDPSRVDSLYQDWQRSRQVDCSRMDSNLHTKLRPTIPLSPATQCHDMTSWINSPENLCAYPNPLVPTYFVAPGVPFPQICGVEFNKQDLLDRLQTYQQIVVNNPATDKKTLQHIIWLQDWIFHLKDCEDYKRLTQFEKDRNLTFILYLIRRLQRQLLGGESGKGSSELTMKVHGPKVPFPAQKVSQGVSHPPRVQGVSGGSDAGGVSGTSSASGGLSRMRVKDTLDYLNLLGKAVAGDYIVREIPLRPLGPRRLSTPSVDTVTQGQPGASKLPSGTKSGREKKTRPVTSIPLRAPWSKIRMAEPIQSIFDYPQLYDNLRMIAHDNRVKVPSFPLPSYRGSAFSESPSSPASQSFSGSPLSRASPSFSASTPTGFSDFGRLSENSFPNRGLTEMTGLLQVAKSPPFFVYRSYNGALAQ